MNRPNQPYRAYLIRCWHVDPEKHPQQQKWRFMIEAVDGQGERHGFTDPQDLLSFLTDEIEKANAEDGREIAIEFLSEPPAVN